MTLPGEMHEYDGQTLLTIRIAMLIENRITTMPMHMAVPIDHDDDGDNGDN